MTSKLTLSIEKKVIKKAKNYAYKNGKSLSRVVQQYLESITTEQPETLKEADLKLKKMFGTVKIPAGLDHRRAYRKYISSKG